MMLSAYENSVAQESLLESNQAVNKHEQGLQLQRGCSRFDDNHIITRYIMNKKEISILHLYVYLRCTQDVHTYTIIVQPPGRPKAPQPAPRGRGWTCP